MVEDRDGQRNTLLVKNGKEGKDRITIGSAALIDQLSEYNKKEKLKIYSFKPWEIQQFGPTSAAKVLKVAAKRVGIVQRVSLQMLSHSSATHLLKDGVGIRQIQLLLGHSSTKTTEIYTHVTRNHLKAVENPLDSLYLSNNQ